MQTDRWRAREQSRILERSARKKIGRGISAAARTSINHKISVNRWLCTEGPPLSLLFYIIPGGREHGRSLSNRTTYYVRTHVEEGTRSSEVARGATGCAACTVRDRESVSFASCCSINFSLGMMYFRGQCIERGISESTCEFPLLTKEWEYCSHIKCFVTLEIVFSWFYEDTKIRRKKVVALVEIKLS